MKQKVLSSKEYEDINQIVSDYNLMKEENILLKERVDALQGKLDKLSSLFLTLTPLQVLFSFSSKKQQFLKIIYG